MAIDLEDLKAKALELSPSERNELILALIASFDGEADDTPESVANAWNEEIARRIDDVESGRTTSVPAEEVFARIDKKLRSAGT